MNCIQARALASDYVDGELDQATCQLLEAHLTGCQSCPPLMAALIGVLAELRTLPDLAPTDTWVLATVARTNPTEETTP